jgi:DNA-binding CsgD family transcriptional regulator
MTAVPRGAILRPHIEGGTVMNNRTRSREHDAVHRHVIDLLGGPVAAPTLYLLRTAAQGDRSLAGELVSAGLDMGELTTREGCWQWGEVPDSPAQRLGRLIRSRSDFLLEDQLEALEALTFPLTSPRLALAHARVSAAAEIRLTAREHDVLDLLCLPLTAAAIARRLGLSPRTVTKHQERLYRKLGTSDRLGTVLHAQRLGLIATPS